MHCPKHIKALSSKAKVIANTEEKVIEEPQQLSCFKCKEIYNSKRRLHDHQKTCSGIDSLTCPRCMKTFDHRSNKSRHIKKGNCKPVSVFEYLKRKGMIENSNSNETNIHGDHNTVNNTNNMTTNIYINNYGKERIDYISFDDLLNILKCYNHSIPNYIKYKHFNPLFPENHNIKYKDNIFFIKKNNEWNIINSGALSNKLYTEGGSELSYHSQVNDEQIKESVASEEVYENIKEFSDYVTKEAEGTDKEIKKEIIDVVKTPIGYIP
jgi:hypothetical protein